MTMFDLLCLSLPTNNKHLKREGEKKRGRYGEWEREQGP